MEPIKYRQRACEDGAKIDAFLAAQRVGVLALPDAEYPYAVPLNYIWKDGCVYFHGAGAGKKVRLLEAEPNVSFTVYHEYGTVTDAVPCHADTAYFSVMVFGKAARVTDAAEAAGALQALVERFLPGFYQQKIGPALVEKYRSGVDSMPVAVYCVRPVHRTAKENAPEGQPIFAPQK